MSTPMTAPMTNRTVDPDNGLFPSAFAAVRATWQPFVLATFLIVLADVAQAFMPVALPFAVMRALILIIAGYAAFRALLSRGRIGGWSAAATDTGHVPWRYAGVMLMILAPLLVLGIIWTAPGGVAHAAQNPGVAAPPRGGTLFMLELAIAPVLMVAYTVIYVLLGTALPETVERGNARLGRAIARGWAHYRKIALSLMFGPWLFRTSVIVLLLMAGILGFHTDFMNRSTGAIQPAALLPMTLVAAGAVFAEVLTAVVLVRAYRRF